MPPANKLERFPVITVRRAGAPDVSRLHAILLESPEAALWSEESLVASLSQGIGWVAIREEGIAGFLLGRAAADEFEILNLAVGKELRRKGIATQLVICAMDHARGAGVRKIFLEVRASNAAAIAFYSRMRFFQCGRRAGYYRDPVDDAEMLVLHMDGNTP